MTERPAPERWPLRRKLRLARTGAVAATLVGAVVWLTSGSDAPQPKAKAAVGRPYLGSGEPVTLVFGGDVHFAGPLEGRLAADPRTALGGTRALLAGGDVAVVNLETAVTPGAACPDRQPKEFAFAAPPSAFAALRGAGVTVATEANNHGLDCGRAGLVQSLAAARAAHFPLIGVGASATQAFAPFHVRRHGQMIAVIAATQVLDDELAAAWTATSTQAGVASAQDPTALLAAVRSARRTADTVVVYLHWGTELQACPNARQPALMQALVAAGADVIVGSHAHVQLGAGYAGQAFVDYGLGNLAFYATGPPSTAAGALAVTVTGRRVDGYRWRPALIEGGVPVPLEGAAATAGLAAWQSLRACTGLAATRSGTAPAAAGGT
ncbi:MAG: Capsule synthesis protein CapA [Conexibacter sp.]|nr:Capsule synthesis protein CapA [Conexibacter sp.]